MKKRLHRGRNRQLRVHERPEETVAVSSLIEPWKYSGTRMSPSFWEKKLGLPRLGLSV